MTQYKIILVSVNLMVMNGTVEGDYNDDIITSMTKTEMSKKLIG